jgi:monoterpene epsilon-lactone hydrolase
MSIALGLLNPWLRAVEKRRMRNASVQVLRRAFEVQARLLFRSPRGVQRRWTQFGGVPCLEVTPRNRVGGRYLLYLHGGGFVFGSPNTHAALVAQLATRLGAQAIIPRYRLAPEAPFPAAPQDVRAAWDGLIAAGIKPKDIVLGGDSAGGALAFGLVAGLCAEGADGPAAVFGFSPLTDLTYSGHSFGGNAHCDVILPAERAVEMAELFLQGHAGDDPCVSPMFAKFSGAPPAWITVGDTEILLDDARRLAARIREGGVTAELIEHHDLPHVWPLFHSLLPEARQTLDELALWIRQQQGWAV